MNSWRPYLIPVVVAFLVTGCASTRPIPRTMFASASNQPNQLFSIRMVDGTHYAAWRYSVTDTTLAIEALSEKDERYQTAVLPIIVPLDHVQSIETGAGWSDKKGLVIICGGVLIVAAVLFLALLNLLVRPVFLGLVAARSVILLGILTLLFQVVAIVLLRLCFFVFHNRRHSNTFLGTS